MTFLQSMPKLLFPALLSALLMTGCTCRQPDPETDNIEVGTPETDNPEPGNPETDYLDAATPPAIVGATPPQSDAEEYVATLTVTRKMKKSQHGDLIVSLGTEGYEPKHDDNFVRDTTRFSAEGDLWARILPHAPDFRIEPEGAKIVKLKPGRNDIRFTLYPKSGGTFSVTADVELFENPECSGIGDSKALETLDVKVSVEGWETFLKGLKELGKKAWKVFLDFWGALLVLLFGALLFVIRRIIKEKTGYGETGGDKPDNDTENET